MKKYSIIFAFLLFFQVAVPANIVQESQRGWLSSLVSGGYDLVRQGLVAAMFAGLVYKAKEYNLQKEAAEETIKALQAKLENKDTSEQDRTQIREKIKEQEAIKNKKATLAQKAAQGVLGLAAVGVVGLNLYGMYSLMRYGDRNYYEDSAGMYHWTDRLTGASMTGTKERYTDSMKEYNERNMSVDEFGAVTSVPSLSYQENLPFLRLLRQGYSKEEAYKRVKKESFENVK